MTMNYQIINKVSDDGKMELIEKGDNDHPKSKGLLKEAEYYMKNGFNHISFIIKNNELEKVVY